MSYVSYIPGTKSACPMESIRAYCTVLVALRERNVSMETLLDSLEYKDEAAMKEVICDDESEFIKVLRVIFKIADMQDEQNNNMP